MGEHKPMGGLFLVKHSSFFIEHYKENLRKEDLNTTFKHNPIRYRIPVF